MTRLGSALCAIVSVCACATPSEELDAGSHDAGRLDAGPRDGGPRDSGREEDAYVPRDAGTDAGSTDAGMDTGIADASEPDAAPVDAGDAPHVFERFCDAVRTSDSLCEDDCVAALNIEGPCGEHARAAVADPYYSEFIDCTNPCARVSVCTASGGEEVYVTDCECMSDCILAGSTSFVVAFANFFRCVDFDDACY
jgi:hypothetical protein